MCVCFVEAAFVCREVVKYIKVTSAPFSRKHIVGGMLLELVKP